MSIFSLFKKKNNNSKESCSKKDSKKKRKTIKEFNIESVIPSLEKRFNENFQSFKGKVEKSYNEIQSKLNYYETSLANLEKVRIGKDIDSQTRRLNGVRIGLANVHRKSFIKKMNNMKNQLKKTIKYEIDSIIQYQQSSLQSIIMSDEKSLRDYAFFQDIIAKESKDATEKFKLLFDAVKNFNNLVSENIGDIISLKNAKNKASSIKNNIKIIKEQKVATAVQTRKIKELIAERKSLEEAFKKIESDKTYLLLLEKKKNLNLEISKVKSEINRNFSIINKPMKKFRYLIQSGIEKIDVNEKKLYKFLDSPVDSLIKIVDSEFTNLILNKLRTSIADNKLKVKNKEKVLQEIKRMVEKDVFKRLVARYNSLEKEFKELKKDPLEENILNSKNEIRTKLNQIIKKIETKSEEIEKTERLIEKLEISIKKGSDDIKKILPSFLENKG